MKLYENKAEEFVIGKACRGIFIVHIGFGDDAGLDVLIRPFPMSPIEVFLHPGIDFGFCCLDVQSAFISADENAAGIVGAFQHEAIGELIEVNLLKAIPRTAHQRNEAVFPAPLFDMLADLVFVYQLGIDGLAIMQLQPLDLLIEGFRRLQIQRIAHNDGKLLLEEFIVGKLIHQSQFLQIMKSDHGIGHKVFGHSKDFGNHRGSFQTAIGELSRLSRQSIYYLTFNIRIIL